MRATNSSNYIIVILIRRCNNERADEKFYFLITYMSNAFPISKLINNENKICLRIKIFTFKLDKGYI